MTTANTPPLDALTMTPEEYAAFRRKTLNDVAKSATADIDARTMARLRQENPDAAAAWDVIEAAKAA